MKPIKRKELNRGIKKTIHTLCDIQADFDAHERGDCLEMGIQEIS